ncbi:MAG TPA: hypothetical protein VK922_13415 [Gemmatimonadaceae bacterium]|nr:hypothetical protein [Gemmatimonadaceae bacterium]
MSTARQAARIPLALAVAANLACDAQRDDVADTARGDTTTAAAEVEAYALVRTVTGFSTPEAARYDGEQDVWFVSNINGAPAARDNNGFISRIRQDGTIDSLQFIAGGRGGITLHAPKGLLVVGDTLWVADLNIVRAFNARTGARIADVTVRGATMLNDLAAGPDGALYVTDTGLEFGVEGAQQQPSRIYRVSGMRAELALESAALNGPNGIAWDGGRDAFVIGSYFGDSLFAWAPGDSEARGIAAGPGQWDGIVILPDGRVLASSWTDSSLYVLEGSTTRKVVSGVASPGAIGIDPQRMQVAIPSLMGNVVDLYRVPGR